MTRAIKTTYFGRNHKIIHINTSKDANRAVSQCVAHMQVNRYGATSAEVYDTAENDVVHAQVKRFVDGSLHIHYRSDYQERYAVTPMVQPHRSKK